MTILILIATPIVLFSIPSKKEKLTKNSWCVDGIYYKGQELTPNTAGFRMVSDTFSASANWKIKKDSLIIYPPDTEEKLYSGGPSELVELENKSLTVREIYYGSYLLKIKNNAISMQSDSLMIIGKVSRFNYSFSF